MQSLIKSRFGRQQKRSRGGIFARIFFGLLIVTGAFVMLWLNEGRVNWADVAQKSTAVPNAAYSPNTEGQFISATGSLTVSDLLSDDLYLRPRPYLLVDRHVEMYAWMEEEESNENDTTYSYSLGWTNNPAAAANFEYPSGHENPPLPVDSARVTANSAQVGDYQFDTKTIKYPTTDPLPLNLDTVREGPYQITEKYVFQGKGTLASPLLGDIRISFEMIPANQTMTVFGVQQESAIVPYLYRDEKSFYRILHGDRPAAIAQLQTEYRNLLWGFRIGGMLLMWLGFGLLFSPFTRLLDFVPVVGKVGKLAVTAVAFVLALILSVTTAVISAIVHNIWALLFVLALLIGGGFYLWRQRQGKMA